jgi:hypothetical protein
MESAELSETTRRQRICSLRRIAKALDQPLELVPARWTAVRIPIGRLHHHPLGMTAKTLANHKANVKAALRRFTGETGGPVRGARLSPAWARLRDGIHDRGVRARPYGLMRFCSAKQIPPSEISDAVLESYLAYRIATSSLAAPRLGPQSRRSGSGQIAPVAASRRARRSSRKRTLALTSHCAPEGSRKRGQRIARPAVLDPCVK